MGSFGDGVVSLLDTYTRCLALLKQLSRGSKASPEHTQLRGSVRSSRSRVRTFYSSKVSESGASFEKGDEPSRSALRRLVRRVKAFVDGLLVTFGRQSNPGIDYESLMTLSNRSGLEAIRTMTDLSERVSARSAKAETRLSGQGRRKSTGSKHGGKSRSSSASSNASKERTASLRRTKLTRESAKPHGKTHTQPSDRAHDGSRRSSSYQRARPSADSLGRCKSTLTDSSDSTKLGEVRRGDHGKQAQATYPLKGYLPERQRLKKGKLFGLFSR